MSLPNINHVAKKTTSRLKLSWNEIQYILCVLFVHICRFEIFLCTYVDLKILIFYYNLDASK